MKKLIVLVILFVAALNAQDRRLWDFYGYYSGGVAVYAGDYDASTEYLSKTDPVNLDLNDTDRVALDIDNDLII